MDRRFTQWRLMWRSILCTFMQFTGCNRLLQRSHWPENAINGCHNGNEMRYVTTVVTVDTQTAIQDRFASLAFLRPSNSNLAFYFLPWPRKINLAFGFFLAFSIFYVYITTS